MPIHCDRCVLAAIWTTAALWINVCAGGIPAESARFWITPSQHDPMLSNYGVNGAVEIDLRRAPDLHDGDEVEFYIWAKPASDGTGGYKQLQNISLNIVTSPGFVDILDEVTVVNPEFDFDGDTIADVERFSVVRDSSFDDPLNPQLQLVTLPAELISLGSPDGVFGLLAANPIFAETVPGVGLGPACLPGDGSCVTTSHGPVWRLASFSLRPLTVEGDVNLHLQIGPSGMSHAGEHSVDTSVVFAPPGESGPTYEAGLNGDRQDTLDGDLPEVFIRIRELLEGDYNANGRVDGNDFLRWQREVGHTSNLTADGDGDGDVDGLDLAIWQQNIGRDFSRHLTAAVGDYHDDGVVAEASYGSVVNGAGDVKLAAGVVPEPPGVALFIMSFAWWGAYSPAYWRGGRRALAC